MYLLLPNKTIPTCFGHEPYSGAFLRLKLNFILFLVMVIVITLDGGGEGGGGGRGSYDTSLIKHTAPP
jgi:hypothetical protein